MGNIRVHRPAYERKDGTPVEAATYLTEDKGEIGRTPKENQWYNPKVHMDWSKDMPTEERRHNALKSHKGDYLSTARALNALANVTTDEQTRVAAWTDAQYFYNLHKGKAIKGYGKREQPSGGIRTGFAKHRDRRHGRILTRSGRIVKIHKGSVLH